MKQCEVWLLGMSNLKVETGECLLLVLHGFHSTPDQRRERSSEAEFSANRLLHSPNFMMDTYMICTTNYYTSLFVSECQNCAVMSFFNRCGTKPPFGDFLPEDIFVYLFSSLTAAVDIISWHIFHYNWQKEVNRVSPLTFVIVFFSNHHGSLFITLDMSTYFTSQFPGFRPVQKWISVYSSAMHVHLSSQSILTCQTLTISMTTFPAHN